MSSPQCFSSALGADVSGSFAGPESMCVDDRDNKLDELVSQQFLVTESGVVEEGVLDPSPSLPLPSDSGSQSGVPKEEVLESSPSFSP